MDTLPLSKQELEECVCSGCMEPAKYSRFYCQECFDQNCKEEENH